MTTIYLHIGMPKTGTTYLQHFLFENREKLLKQGYLYPLPTKILNKQNITSKNHHGLANGLLKIYRTKNPCANEQLNSNNMEGRWENMKREIKTLKPKNVIISSEAFTAKQEFYNPDIIELVKKKLDGYETKIVIYIRRQDEFFMSWYNQNVKFPIYFNNFPQINDINYNNMKDIMQWVGQNKKIGDFYSILEPWRKSFGIKNIIVRIFEKEQMTNGSLLDDFFETIDFNHNQSDFDLSHAMIRNVSLNGKIIKIKNLMDEISQMKRFKKNHQARYYFEQSVLVRKYMTMYTNLTIKLAFIMSRFIPDFLINEELLSKEDKANIMNEFETSNRKVAQEYLGRSDGRLFYSSP
ncbi:MAG: hypothetical protein RH949_19590 [Coleofasciculus sp. A1-SPW-01]|uniref:hypothetical protein n=1 Tax=Coleofasciculus sp. A1-SPW-01 TaxID=3070819 RepID=UPI0032F5E170